MQMSRVVIMLNVQKWTVCKDSSSRGNDCGLQHIKVEHFCQQKGTNKCGSVTSSYSVSIINREKTLKLRNS